MTVTFMKNLLFHETVCLEYEYRHVQLPVQTQSGFI